MVTIVHHRDTGAENLVVLSTIETAQEFLDGLADRYRDVPGMVADRLNPFTLAIMGKLIGEPRPHVVSTYTINPQETLND